MSVQENIISGEIVERSPRPLDAVVGLHRLPDPIYNEDGITLYCADCTRVLPLLEPMSVNMVACDLPYGITQNDWDVKLDLSFWWNEIKRICSGAIVLTARQPFTSELVMSNREGFKWEDIWKKTQATGHLNANRMPMREHENILVFGDKITFNPQIKQKPKENIRPITGASSQSSNYGKYDLGVHRVIANDQSYPSSVVEFANSQERLHPTQKPVDLFQYLILSYSNEGDIVLDATAGSGTTLVAAKCLGRKAIGIEISEKYCRIAIDRLRQRELFLQKLP